MARMPLQRRGYAEAVSDKIKLSLVLPHQVRLFCSLGELAVVMKGVSRGERMRCRIEIGFEKR